MFSNRLCLELQPSNQDSGSAAVDFILTAIPLTLMFIAAISISTSSYVLSVIRDSAVEGARFAALADQSSLAGCQKSLSLMQPVLVSSLNPQVECKLVEINGQSYERVRIEVEVPLTGSLLKSSALKAEGWAPREDQ